MLELLRNLNKNKWVIVKILDEILELDKITEKSKSNPVEIMSESKQDEIDTPENTDLSDIKSSDIQTLDKDNKEITNLTRDEDMNDDDFEETLNSVSLDDLEEDQDDKEDGVLDKFNVEVLPIKDVFYPK